MTGALASVFSMAIFGAAYAAGPDSADHTPIPLLSLVSGVAQSAPVIAEGQQARSADTDSSQSGESGKREFLFFRDDPVLDPVTDGATNNLSFSSEITTFTPRGAPLPGGVSGNSFPDEIGVLNSFTPSQVTANLGVRFGSAETEQEKRQSFQLSLSSSIKVQPVNLSGLFTQTLPGSDFDRRTMNLGLNIGYSGFSLGAFLVRETGGLTSGYEGVDVGLSYRGSSWSTSLTVGEYSRQYNNLFITPLGSDDRFYALQFGANYYLYPALRLSGGVRFFEYGPGFGLIPDQSSRSQLFYLGTNLNF